MPQSHRFSNLWLWCARDVCTLSGAGNGFVPRVAAGWRQSQCRAQLPVCRPTVDVIITEHG